MICYKAGCHGPAETQHGGCNDNGDGRLEVGDDGAHAQAQDELGQKHHARDDTHVGTDAASDGLVVRGVLAISPALLLLQVFIVLKNTFNLNTVLAND